MNILGPQAGLVELVNHFTMQKATREADDKKQYNPLSPSAAGKCARELAYSYAVHKGVLTLPTVVEPPTVQRLLNLGYFIENHVVQEFKKAFSEAGSEIKLRYAQQYVRIMQKLDGSFVEGKIDGCFISPTWKSLIDYKSKKDKFSKGFKSSWDEDADFLREEAHQFAEDSFWIDDLDAFIQRNKYTEPFLCDNFYQLNLYFFDMHGFFSQVGIDHCSILQYNKNDSRLREIRFRPSQKIADYVIDKFKRVDHAVTVEKNPDLVDREFELGSVKCAFCHFREICHGEDAKKPWYDTFPKKYWPKDTERMGEDGATLEDLYQQLQAVDKAIDQQEVIEQKMLLLLDKNRCFKVKFNDGKVLEVKTYKTGGIANGPRKALKVGKL